MMILMGTTLWLFKNSYGSHGPFTDDKTYDLTGDMNGI